jgi:pantoate--beta-alanine ligase
MKIFPTPQSVQEQCAAWRKAGQSVALVPTMGFFHQGHVSLMQAARKTADKVVVSLFVNPSQFGPAEDLGSYPRDPERDRAMAGENGVDLLFTPSSREMYPLHFGTWVSVPSLSETLCGKTRPTHFKGVCTVVLKLLNICTPDFAFFGEKDWQQLTIIKRMAEDLNLPVQIVGGPLVREADGLAMSSRNSYLTPKERFAAAQISQGLREARARFATGERSAAKLEKCILDYWRDNLPQGRVDYLELVHPDTLEAQPLAKADTRMVTAVYLGKARLIDNMPLG